VPELAPAQGLGLVSGLELVPGLELELVPGLEPAERTRQRLE